VAEEYELQLERRALRSLDRLPVEAYQRVSRAIDALALDPRPRGMLRVHGHEPLMRIRVGDYRIIYAVFDRERLVKIVHIVRRDDQTYERL
jgi:mRNA interferase RelE/StbE